MYQIHTALKLEVLSEGKLTNFSNKFNSLVQFNFNNALLSLTTPGVICFKFERYHLAPIN